MLRAPRPALQLSLPASAHVYLGSCCAVCIMLLCGYSCYGWLTSMLRRFDVIALFWRVMFENRRRGGHIRRATALARQINSMTRHV